MLKEKLNFLKNERRVTVETIAKDAGLPIGTLNKLFSGETDNPRMETLNKLKDYFGCTLDYLIVEDVTDKDAYSPNSIAQPGDFWIIDGKKIRYEDLPEEAQKEFDAFVRLLQKAYNL